MEEELVVRRLGWAGLELEAGGRRLVIDLFENRHAFEPFMEVNGELPVPSGPVDVALVTHLHADHTDPDALSRSLVEGARLYRPASAPGDDLDRYMTSAAEQGIASAGIDAVVVEPWQTFEEGPFTITAVPATDGFGDPQVSWVVEAAGRRIFHGGDTMFHGAWFPIASRFKPFDAAFLPINGPKCSFPHRQPASPFPVALDPQQAAAAAAMLGAELAVPIHYEGIDVPGIYEPVADPEAVFRRESESRDLMVEVLSPGEALEWTQVSA